MAKGKDKKNSNTAKIIVKETILLLLFALAIILIFGVILYQYIPTNKIIPETISYITPENVKTELQTDENVDTSEVVVTYQIDSTDLSNYKKIQEYVPGKKNPFSSVTTGTSETSSTTDSTNTSTATDNNSNGTNSSNSGTSTNSSSTSSSTNAGYLPDKGTK